MIKIAIIGTAGRKNDAKIIKKKHFNFMVEKSKELVNDYFNLDSSKIHLISGGAAWSDHVAVQLFIDNFANKLTIFSPCDWDTTNRNFNNGNKFGKTANYYHSIFSKKIGHNSLEQIDDLVKAKLDNFIFDSSSIGFMNRNTKISKCDYLIAFTFQPNKELYQPKSGGTKNTWDKAKKILKKDNMVHINLYTM